MAKQVFIPVNEYDTREMRKELGLPIFKSLRYMKHVSGNDYEEIPVTGYEIVDSYYPSGSKSLMISLETGDYVRILSDYFSDMQKPNFVSVMLGDGEAAEELVPGKSIIGFPDDYVVVDLETTGRNHYEDVIIEIGAIKYKNGIETGRFTELVYTDQKVPTVVYRLTGINNQLLEMQRKLKEVLTDFEEFIGDNVLIGHNIKTFDSYFLKDAYDQELGRPMKNDYIDTMEIAKKVLPDLSGYSLEVLCGYYGIDYSKAHRAVEDCDMTGQVYQILKKECGGKIPKKKKAAEQTQSEKPKKGFYNAVKVTEITKEEGVEADPHGVFYGKNCVVTGEFSKYDRAEILQLLVNLGAVNKSGVSAKTDYLIVGDLENVNTVAAGKSSKVIKAEELQTKGKPIQIIGEDEFLELMNKKVSSEKTGSIEKFDNYKTELEKAMREICEKNRLFPNSLQYKKSTSKKITGYRIQIFEEEYPAPKDVPHEKRKGVYDPYSIALIKEVEDESDVHFGMLLICIREAMKEVSEVPRGAEMTSAPDDYFGFYINPDDNQLMPYLKKLMEARLKDYRSSNNSFGCCSSFINCSDAKQCVHYNMLYATGCRYRVDHLDKGEIFYGKNRNID